MSTKLPFHLTPGIPAELEVEALHIPARRQVGGSFLTLRENGRRFRQALTIFAFPDEEEILGKTINFDEAAEKLNGVLDLNEARRQAIHQQELWGLIEGLKKTGDIREKEEYAALFDEIKFTEKGIRIVRALLEQGYDMVPIFNPGHLSLKAAYDVLVKDSGTPHWERSPALGSLNDVQKISPNPSDLEGLTEYHSEVQIAALVRAYYLSKKLLPRPSLTFTPLETEVTLTERTAIQLLQSGVQTIDPVSDWILWRMFIDARFGGESAQTPEAYRTARDQFLRTRKEDEPLPGSKSSVYPNYVLPDGGIVAFTCDHDGTAKLISYCPDDASKWMGSRIVIT